GLSRTQALGEELEQRRMQLALGGKLRRIRGEEREDFPIIRHRQPPGGNEGGEAVCQNLGLPCSTGGLPRSNMSPVIIPSLISPSGLGSRVLPGRPWTSPSIPTSGAGAWRLLSGLRSSAAEMCWTRAVQSLCVEPHASSLAA